MTENPYDIDGPGIETCEHSAWNEGFHAGDVKGYKRAVRELLDFAEKQVQEYEDVIE